MPNGGSDCCGTCWFNKANKGEWGASIGISSLRRSVASGAWPSVIPSITYRANHPYRRGPFAIRIPIGPILVHSGWGQNSRKEWYLSPDNEVIRLHLLALIHDAHVHLMRDRYPLGPGLVISVIRQLGEFREARVVERLDWLARKGPAEIAGEARMALSRIGPPHQNNTAHTPVG